MSSMRMAVAIASLLVAPFVAAQQTAAPSTTATASAADGAPTVTAVWMEKKIFFPYMAFTAFYSCDGLRNKVRAALEAIGARPGFEVKARGCPNLSGPEPLPWLDIVAAMPIEATAEVLAELARNAPERELAAMVTGNDAADEATARFPARPRQISFSDDPMGLFQAGDCELVEQLRDKVFVPLGARIVSSDMICVPRQVNVGAVDLTIEVLEPVPVQ
jgi:hypothetical protein